MISDPFAAFAEVGDHRIDASFVDHPHSGGRNAQSYIALLAFEPEPVVVQVRFEPTARTILRVRHVVAAHRPLTRHLAHLSHGEFAFCPEKTVGLYTRGTLLQQATLGH